MTDDDDDNTTASHVANSYIYIYIYFRYACQRRCALRVFLICFGDGRYCYSIAICDAVSCGDDGFDGAVDAESTSLLHLLGRKMRLGAPRITIEILSRIVIPYSKRRWPIVDRLSYFLPITSQIILGIPDISAFNQCERH